MSERQRAVAQRKSLNRASVIRKCLRERGFRLVKATEGEPKPKWDIWWSDRGDLLKDLPRLSAFQKINHFPAMEEICRKDFLANNLNAICKVLPDAFDFFPRSFLLPAESVELQACMDRAPKNATFIAKPRTLCQGKGITLVQSFAKVPKDPCVVQRYIDNPLLIDGFKFDLRIYVLVLSVHPLQIYIFKNGLARFCTSAFEKPTKRNLSQKRMHLTNYAVNKHSKHFQQAADEHRGSKRSLASVMKLLDDMQRGSSDRVWTQICDIVVKTLLCIQPKLSATYKSFFGESDATWGPKCFEVLGYDIMLDASGKAWLFEVNHAPSFAGDSPLDREIKSALIASTLALVGVTNEKKRAFLRRNRLEWSKRLWKTQPALLGKKTSTATAAAESSSSLPEPKSNAAGDAQRQQQPQPQPQQRGQGLQTSRRSHRSLSARSKMHAADAPDEGDAATAVEPRQNNGNDDSEGASDASDDNGASDEDDDDKASSACSGSEPESDSQGGSGQESGDNQRPRSSASGSATGTPAPVKLPSIRNVFQKTNRVVPCTLETATTPVAHNTNCSAVGAAVEGVSDTPHASIAFSNEFVQIYPVDSRASGTELSATDTERLRLLYERVRAAADVNKSKLWS